MSDTTKTTVYLDADVYRRLKQMAQARGTSTAFLLREAAAEYAASAKGVPRPSSIGVGRSGRGDVGARAEELLEGMGRRK